MFEIFRQEMDVTIVMLFLFVVSILCKLIPGIWYHHLILEVDNMSATDSMLLKQCKLKFSNCYQLNGGVANVGIFVDKFMGKLTVGPFSFERIDRFSGQALILSIFAAGVGVCRSMIKGRFFLEIIPFYGVCILGIYLYYAIAGIVNIKGLRRMLRINLIDYLENHLSSRLVKTNRDVRELSEGEAPVRKKTVNVPLTRPAKKEPELKTETMQEIMAKEPEETEDLAEVVETVKTEPVSIKEISQKDSKKKTTTKRSIKIVPNEEKSEPNIDQSIENKKTDQTPPRSVNPEEIREILKELLNYS